MNILSLENITKAYASKVLFENINFGIDENDRIGIVGVNGTGKTTFLRLIAGDEKPDKGLITRSNGLTVRYLPQNPHFNEEFTVLEQVFSGNDPIMKSLRAYEAALANLALNPDDLHFQNVLVQTSSEIDRLDSWQAETHAKNILGKLGVNDLQKKINTLSGGQRKRVAMAEALIQPADLLILDEPTNHLDYETIDWLETYLKGRKGALILVTHDRYFLNRVTNRTVEIDKSMVYSYEGNFEYFLEKKAMREEMNARADEKRKRLFASELEWIRRGPQGRGTKQKARIQRFEALEQGIKTSDEEGMTISVAYTRMGKKCIELEAVTKSYGTKCVLNQLTYTVKPTERLAIVGANGAGKTTLLNLLARQLTPDAGVIEVGETVKLGYYTQENSEMNYEQRVIDYIKETAEFVETADGFKLSASQMLERFLFDSNLQYSLIRHLSGGERRRLLLAKILMEAPNVLLLDEPTNDLDIQTLEILEEYLDYFRGAVIVVSHDRYFIDKTADHLLAVLPNGKTQLFNDLEAYRREVANHIETQTENIVEKELPSKTRTNEKLKFTYNEKREFETIDAVIEEIEMQMAALHDEMEAASASYSKLQDLTEKREGLEQLLSEKMDRWAYLNELNERIENQS